jgi:hypothetical protein
MTEALNSPYLFVLAILIITVAVPTITYYWQKTRRAEIDASLKQDMLQRGMSADDIKTVLESSSDRFGKCGRGTARRGVDPEWVRTRD